MSQRRRTGSHPITDREGLAILIEGAVQRRFGGSQRAAARALAAHGCHQRELNRLIRCEVGAITDRTVGWVMALVPDGHSELRSVLLSEKARRLLNSYRKWMEKKTSPPGYEENEMRHWLYIQKEQLSARLRRRFPSQFAAFETWARKRGHHESRVQLALERVGAPLLEFDPSGFVERHWSELSSEELARFVRCGLVRERVLLQRAPEVRRAQVMAESALKWEHHDDVMTLADISAIDFGHGLRGSGNYA